MQHLDTDKKQGQEREREREERKENERRDVKKKKRWKKEGKVVHIHQYLLNLSTEKRF